MSEQIETKGYFKKLVDGPDNYVLSEESAKEQLNILLDFYDVDLESLDEEGKLKKLIERKLIRAIRQGKVEIENDTEGFVVKQNICNGTQFVYREISGMAKVQMDRFTKQHERLYALLGFLSKKPIEKVQQITGQDLAIAEYLGLIFLAG